MSTNVLHTSGIADALAVQIADYAFKTLKGNDASSFFFSSLDLSRIENLGAQRVYEAVFQSLTNREQRVKIILGIWKDCRVSRGASGQMDTLEEFSNWKSVLVELIDENSQWEYRIHGLVEWQENIPTLKFGSLRDKKPTKGWLERETYKTNRWWREDDGYKEAVFCPDRKFASERVVFFGNEALARTFIKLTDPDHSLRRSLSYPNVCPHCGNEYDVVGECGNECSVYAEEPEEEPWLA